MYHLDLILFEKFAHDLLQLHKSLRLYILSETLETTLEVEDVVVAKAARRLQEVEAKQCQTLVQGHSTFVDGHVTTHLEPLPFFFSFLLDSRLEVNSDRDVCQHIVLAKELSFLNNGACYSIDEL